ncbi:MAG: hypothetical protein U9N73_11355, partial [Candidatus Auribacterota bacterium]|nr:hypothetical protein [Candidatus Auribacterota bacterium]
FFFVFSRDLPAGDSHTYYFPAFESILNAVRDGNLFPQWFAANGGVRIGFFHINLISTLPGRVLAYYLLSFTPISTVVIYKIQYLASVLLMGFGWWMALKQLTRSRLAAYFGTLMVIMGGTGITFHQEQVLGVTCYIPWFVYSILKIRDDTRYIFPAVTLFGLGLTVYYPQINLLSMGTLAVLLSIFYPVFLKKIFREQKKRAYLLPVLFILAILPSIYILYYNSNLTSSIRTEKAMYFPKDYSEYILLNRAGGETSALPSYLLQYLNPTVQVADIEGYGEMPDRCSFFVGRIGLLMVLFGIILKPHRAIPIIILLICSVALALGINFPLPIPRYLFLIRVPTIALFRQWLHFFPLINFCLSALAAIGFAAFLNFARRKSNIMLSAVVPIILFLQIAELSFYDLKYCFEFQTTEAITNMEDNFFNRRDYAGIHWFQYKNRHRLYHTCPEAIPTGTYLTTNTITVDGGEEDELEKIRLILTMESDQTVIDTPMKGMIQANKQIKNLPCPATANSRGLKVRVSAPGAALLVTPLNYDLGATAFLDDEETPLIRVNGALSGVVVPKGYHRVSFIIPWDIYWFLVWIQWVLYLFIALFFLRKNNIDKTPKR